MHAPVLQERILNDLSLEMETTSNRLDFVQVCSLAIFSGFSYFAFQFAYPHVKTRVTIFFLTPIIQSQNEALKCLVPFCGAEKSGHGDEEGWHQGSDHVDRVPGCSIHHSFRFGVLDIAKCTSCLI